MHNNAWVLLWELKQTRRGGWKKAKVSQAGRSLSARLKQTTRLAPLDALGGPANSGVFIRKVGKIDEKPAQSSTCLAKGWVRLLPLAGFYFLRCAEKGGWGGFFKSIFHWLWYQVVLGKAEAKWSWHATETHSQHRLWTPVSGSRAQVQTVRGCT